MAHERDVQVEYDKAEAENKKEEEEKEGVKGDVGTDVGQGEVPRKVGVSSDEVLLLLHHHIKNEEAISRFLEKAHEKYTLGFAETYLQPPVYLDWVLGDQGHG